MQKLFSILSAVTLATAFFIQSVSAASVTCGNWILEYVTASGTSTTDIIITRATGEGSLDLTHINGLEAVGATPSAFAYNSRLTSLNVGVAFKSFDVQLASTMQIDGKGTPYSGSSETEGDEGLGTVTLPFNLNEHASRITMHVTATGTSGNAYGSCLLASGSEPFLDGSYSGGFQIFLRHAADGTQTLTVKNGESTSGTQLSHPTGTEFDVELYYNPSYNLLMISARYSDGTVDSVTCRPTSFSVDEICYALPDGIDETVTVADACAPFAGCSSLTEITTDSGNKDFENGTEGILLTADRSKIAAYPYGRIFNRIVRIRSVANPEECLSVNLYASGDGYEARSADFQNPSEYFGTTLFRLVANDNGTCSFRHLNSGFLLGRKSDSQSSPVDAVQDPQYSGQYDYSLLPGSPTDAEFVFTDQYVGPVDSFEGVWMMTYDNGNAMLEKGVSEAQSQHLFTIEEAESVSVPLNSSGYATVCLPTDITVPASGAKVLFASAFSESTSTLTVLPLPSGMRVPAGQGLIVSNPGGTEAVLPVMDDNTNPPMFDNLLTGTNLRQVGTTSLRYSLDGDAFVRVAGGDIAPNSAYLGKEALPSDADPANISVHEDILTSAEATEDDSEAASEAYTLSGCRATSHRGIVVTRRGKYISL